MGARSAVHTEDKPWPVVYDALLACLPAAGYRITATERGRGHIHLRAANTELVVAVGAVDAVTTEWVVTSQLRFGMFRDRHDVHVSRIAEALTTHLVAHYA